MSVRSVFMSFGFIALAWTAMSSAAWASPQFSVVSQALAENAAQVEKVGYYKRYRPGPRYYRPYRNYGYYRPYPTYRYYYGPPAYPYPYYYQPYGYGYYGPSFYFGFGW